MDVHPAPIPLRPGGFRPGAIATEGHDERGQRRVDARSAHARVEQAAAGEEALSSALYGGVAGGLTDEVADFVTMVMSDMLDTQQSLPAAG
mgnify:CR=1 FL=1